ncbi:MAG: DUF2007 domain-containing protein [Ignavibacteria bacterium]|nr:DUF2007 domain-containing protein [Ignavibacteria bacterium]
MKQNKFLRYCPNCYHYNKTSGICSYINLNVREDPGEFIKYCDGKYLSLIEGKAIKPLKENDRPKKETKDELVTVFTSNSNILFQFAKSVLDNNKIKYVTTGDYLNSLEGYVYSSQIKVFKQYAEVSRKLLSEIEHTVYEPSNITDKKIKSFVGSWGMAILLLLIIAIMILYIIIINN